MYVAIRRYPLIFFYFILALLFVNLNQFLYYCSHGLSVDKMSFYPYIDVIIPPKDDPKTIPISFRAFNCDKSDVLFASLEIREMYVWETTKSFIIP